MIFDSKRVDEKDKERSRHFEEHMAYEWRKNELVDWDVLIGSPPERPSDSIRVTVVDGGYRRPKIVYEK